VGGPRSAALVEPGAVRSGSPARGGLGPLRAVLDGRRPALRGPRTERGPHVRRSRGRSSDFFRIAAGSAAEVDAVLEVAVGFGYVGDDEVTKARSLLDRQLALLWGLTHRRR